ncbi:hypothetical protein DMR_10360 [Solidesulfovibrio magneticus RS-1]|uniref:Uncharacterized protein n=1 Tax=Solidesulfovibrio magneticus (strain ATCC 700980 / DSM 13731 / RS-1) TaxID=573370 RepID=C4XKY8_SOLM1|nr:hypothetical protein DMR_10360 [Solidesulfovibrio magneticus RS-1]
MKNPLLFAIYNIFGDKSLHTEKTKIAICIYFTKIYILINDDYDIFYQEKKLQLLKQYLFPYPNQTNQIYEFLLNSEITKATEVLHRLLSAEESYGTKHTNIYSSKKPNFH